MEHIDYFMAAQFYGCTVLWNIYDCTIFMVNILVHNFYDLGK